MSVCVCVCVPACVMCFLGSLLHIHAFPWGRVDRLLWESTSEREGDSWRGREGVCVCVCVFVCVLGLGACVGKVVSAEVWLVPKDLGATEQSRWRKELGGIEARASILGQVQECPVGSLPEHTHTLTHTQSISCFLDKSTITAGLFENCVAVVMTSFPMRS